jgi:hypothetical protein
MRESCSSGSVGAPPGNRWRYPDSDLRALYDHPTCNTGPPTHKECLLFPHASVSRARRVRLQHFLHKTHSLCSAPLFGMPCSMASSRQQPKSREPSIQHGYPSHALPRNDAPPCHASCLRPGSAPRLRSPLLTSLTGSAPPRRVLPHACRATLPFTTRLRLAGHRLPPVPVHPAA